MSKLEINCLNCSSNRFAQIHNYKNLIRVSSDSKYIKKDGNISVCKKCGLIQKNINKKYIKEINKIYQNYEMYKITEGEDQRLLGQTYTRAQKLINIIKKNVKLDKFGSMIDIGCGTGSFLKEFGNKYKNWDLFGYEITKRNIKYLRSIKNFKILFNKDPNRKFNFISIIHTFEHIVNHWTFFKMIKSISNFDSKIFIQIPNFNNSMYDILIADHTAHYDKTTIVSTLQKFLDIEFYSEEIDKEITIIGKIKNNFESAKVKKKQYFINYNKLKKRIKYFENLKKIINKEKKNFLVYGTTIASSWITGNYRERITAYIEDDIRKINKKFYYKKIKNIKNTNLNDRIVLPFSTNIIKKIVNKNKNKHFLYLEDQKYI
jgi:SAM-dependent methyltransferase